MRMYLCIRAFIIKRDYVKIRVSDDLCDPLAIAKVNIDKLGPK